MKQDSNMNLDRSDFQPQTVQQEVQQSNILSHPQKPKKQTRKTHRKKSLYPQQIVKQEEGESMLLPNQHGKATKSSDNLREPLLVPEAVKQEQEASIKQFKPQEQTIKLEFEENSRGTQQVSLFSSWNSLAGESYQALYQRFESKFKELQEFFGEVERQSVSEQNPCLQSLRSVLKIGINTIRSKVKEQTQKLAQLRQQEKILAYTKSERQAMVNEYVLQKKAQLQELYPTVDVQKVYNKTKKLFQEKPMTFYRTAQIRNRFNMSRELVKETCQNWGIEIQNKQKRIKMKKIRKRWLRDLFQAVFRQIEKEDFKLVQTQKVDPATKQEIIRTQIKKKPLTHGRRLQIIKLLNISMVTLWRYCRKINRKDNEQ